jgi:hypothetical protein
MSVPTTAGSTSMRIVDVNYRAVLQGDAGILPTLLSIITEGTQEPKLHTTVHDQAAVVKHTRKKQNTKEQSILQLALQLLEQILSEICC